MQNVLKFTSLLLETGCLIKKIAYVNKKNKVALGIKFFKIVLRILEKTINHETWNSYKNKSIKKEQK